MLPQQWEGLKKTLLEPPLTRRLYREHGRQLGREGASGGSRLGGTGCLAHVKNVHVGPQLRQNKRHSSFASAAGIREEDATASRKQRKKEGARNAAAPRAG